MTATTPARIELKITFITTVEQREIVATIAVPLNSWDPGTKVETLLEQMALETLLKRQGKPDQGGGKVTEVEM